MGKETQSNNVNWQGIIFGILGIFAMGFIFIAQNWSSSLSESETRLIQAEARLHEDFLKAEERLATLERRFDEHVINTHYKTLETLYSNLSRDFSKLSEDVQQQEDRTSNGLKVMRKELNMATTGIIN